MTDETETNENSVPVVPTPPAETVPQTEEEAIAEGQRLADEVAETFDIPSDEVDDSPDPAPPYEEPQGEVEQIEYSGDVDNPVTDETTDMSDVIEAEVDDEVPEDAYDDEAVEEDSGCGNDDCCKDETRHHYGMISAGGFEIFNSEVGMTDRGIAMLNGYSITDAFSLEKFLHGQRRWDGNIVYHGIVYTPADVELIIMFDGLTVFDHINGFTQYGRELMEHYGSVEKMFDIQLPELKIDQSGEHPFLVFKETPTTPPKNEDAEEVKNTSVFENGEADAREDSAAFAKLGPGDHMMRARYRKANAEELRLMDEIKALGAQMVNKIAEVEKYVGDRPKSERTGSAIADLAHNDVGNLILGVRHIEDGVSRVVKAIMS